MHSPSLLLSFFSEVITSYCHQLTSSSEICRPSSLQQLSTCRTPALLSDGRARIAPRAISSRSRLSSLRNRASTEDTICDGCQLQIIIFSRKIRKTLTISFSYSGCALLEESLRSSTRRSSPALRNAVTLDDRCLALPLLVRRSSCVCRRDKSQ